MPTIKLDDLQTLVKNVFMATGSKEKEAHLVAEYLVRSNLCGVDSHGVIRVPDYVQGIKAGTLKPNIDPKVVSDRGATAKVDAGFGFGQVSTKIAMELAIGKARRYGVGVVAVFNGNHAGRIAEYPLLAAREDMIGLAMVKAYGSIVAPWGGRKRLLSTSPFSFAIPSKRYRPIVGDFATSTSAEGKVRVRYARGEKVPQGWLIDKSGRPTENPADLYEGGAILPFGQWKGYALNLLMEATGGALSGAGVLTSLSGLNGVLVQAIDIAFFGDVEEFKGRVDTLIETISGSPPAEGVDRVLIPGDPESLAMEKRLAEGIPVEEKTWDALASIATAYGVRLPSV